MRKFTPVGNQNKEQIILIQSRAALPCLVWLGWWEYHLADHSVVVQFPAALIPSQGAHKKATN